MSRSKESILNKSKSLFQQYGYGKTTLTDIAKSVGKVKSAIYYYFSGKDEIFANIVQHEAKEFLDRLMEETNKGSNPLEQLEIYIETRVALMQKIAKRYSFLKKEFFELMPIVEENRKETDILEKQFITFILQKINIETADVDQSQFKAQVLVNTIKGLEIQMYVTDQLKINDHELGNFKNFLLYGVLTNTKS